MHCTACMASNEPDATFCASCGRNIVTGLDRNDNGKKSIKLEDSIATVIGLGIVASIIGLIIWGFLYITGMRLFLPDIEIPNEVAKYIKIYDCEYEGGSISIDCKMSNVPPARKTNINQYSAVYYDDDGVRIGISRFPNQNIIEDEAVKAQLLLSPDMSDISKVIIGY